jgi:uncharacterized protein
MKRLLTAAVFLASSLTAPELYAQEKIVTVGTGAVIGVYYPAGGAICRLVNRGRKEHSIRCFAESTAGSMNNLQGLRDGELNFAIAQSDWQFKAYHGEDVYAENGPFADLRSVFSLHSEMFTVAAGKNSGIKTFAGLKGKRVNVGDAGSGMRDLMAGLMNSLHWKPSYFAKTTELKPSDAVKELCAGRIDAMVIAIGHPNGLVQEVTSNCGAKLIPVEGREVDALIASNPYYSRSAIPGGMYQGNAQNTATFGMKAALVTTAAMDDETVYQLTKAVFDNFDSFKTLHFVFSTLDREKMVSSGIIAPIHPGALRYYKEVGLIKDQPKQ